MSFKWNNFDSTFMYEIIKESELSDKEKNKAKYAYENEDKDILIGVMNSVCDCPDKKFIMNYRSIIENMVLKYQSAEVTKICRALKIQARTKNERQIQMTRKATSASLIQAYVSALHNISGMDIQMNEFSKFKMTMAVNMSETAIEDVELYKFQEEAVDKLKKHFVTEDQKRGMLVMPTGSGKSRTAITFLIKEMVSQGYQVLWIAHRHMLIDQAADTFYNFSGLAKINNPGIRNYRISCISGEHMRINTVDKHEVIVASISSICRNKEHLRRILGNKVMIVVDEMHHAYAPTYRDTINFIEKNRKNSKLLGLTATPIRANEEDSKALLQMFDNNIVYSASLEDLIAKGILATPKFDRVETGEEFEPEITLDEEKLLRKFGELPETLVNKIAASNTRNDLIIDKYMKNADKYGKTLIFALNVIHCRFLHEELTKRGVKCGLVYSGKEDNSAVINKFRDGKLDVLVNVNIMTEGTDVPDIQTVFLTRPTSSEGFLMQMIGRGMRGKKAKGTETVNIIDFHDKWETFNKWLNPEWLLTDEPIEITDVPREKRKTMYVLHEWELCREIYKGIKYRHIDSKSTLMHPVCWYTLVDEDNELTRMLVFEDQLDAIKKMIADKNQWIDDESFNAEKALSKYFRGFQTRPNKKDLELLIDNYRTMDIPPQRHIIANRKDGDPYYVAQRLDETGEDTIAVAEKIYEENSTVRDLYESKEEYAMAVFKAKLYKDRTHIIGLKVEELPLELIPFDRTPKHDLPKLVQDVKNEMFGGVYEGISSIEWTDKVYKTFYGRFDPNDNSILINKILDSNEVPEEVVKFVIYHELLHRDNRSHNAEFKAEEHKYPKFEEWEYFLDGKMNQYDISEM